MSKIRFQHALSLSALVSLSTFGSLIVFPNLPSLTSIFHLHHTLINFSILTFMLGTACSQLLSAYALNHYSSSTVLKSALLILWLGIVLSIYGFYHGNFINHCIGRFLQGIGSGSGYLLPYIYIQQQYSYEESRFFYAITNLSFAIIPYLASYIGAHITPYGNLPATLLVFGGYATFIYLTSQTPLSNLKVKASKNLRHRIQTLCSHPLLLMGALCVGTLSGALYLMLSISPHIALKHFSLNMDVFANWQLLFICTALIGHSSTIFFSKRLKGETVLIFAAFFALLLIFLFWANVMLPLPITATSYFILLSLLASCAPMIYGNVFPIATRNVSYPIESSMFLTLSNHLFSIVCISLSILGKNFTVNGLLLALTSCWTLLICILLIFSYQSKRINYVKA